MTSNLHDEIKLGLIRVHHKSPPELRFWKKVNKDGPIHPVLGTRCWIWFGNKMNRGYGRFIHKGKVVQTHRYSWQLHNGRPAGELCVLHHCDNPICVNPEHLFVGTYNDNNQDMFAKGRDDAPRGEVHWNTHLTDEQVREIKRRYKSTGRRGCRQKLAAEFNISPREVYRIGTGKRWGHISIEPTGPACLFNPQG